jgi:hypothetical protein
MLYCIIAVLSAVHDISVHLWPFISLTNPQNAILFFYPQNATPSVPKYKMFYSIIDMHVCRHFLVCRLEAKGVNLYTKKHLDTCVAMMG